jgi:glutamine amidotransferase-like uncharacterized protein
MKGKKIGLYISDGVTSNTINVWLKHYKSGLIKDLSVLKTGDFIYDTLKEYNCIILPGGSGSKICNCLEDKGKKALIEYVHQGGKVLGVCAGAYAVSAGYDWSMGLINYELIDKVNAHRGERNMTFRMTDKGKKLLKIKEDFLPNIYYHNGPVWKKYITDSEDDDILMVFTEDIYSEKGSAGQVVDTPAMVYSNRGLGHVVAISPHFEKSPGYEYVIRKVLQFLIKL